MMEKDDFAIQLGKFVAGLENYVSTKDGQWTVKGFVDIFKNVYAISADTKVVSKILEIHIFPKILEDELQSIVSVVRNFRFFVAEKWKIASDKSGSGNTANIGSINNISDIINGRGMFSRLGESWFDDYWMNYRKITAPDGKGGTKKIATLREFVEYRNGDVSLVLNKRNAEA